METAYLTQNSSPGLFVANLIVYLLKEKASHLDQYWTSTAVQSPTIIVVATSTVNIAETAYLTQKSSLELFVANLIIYLIKE